LPPGFEALAFYLTRWGSQYRERAAGMLEQAAKAGVTTLTCGDADYPPLLTRHLGEARPPLLFVLGDLELMDGPSAGVVGTRKPSDGGRFLAEGCAESFAAHGIPVVSGGARGVDSIAHAAALDSGGKTLVVLPQGLLSYRGPAALREAVDEGRAALLSEFVPDAEWETYAAVTRNATISALSRMVCVIEPKKRGGSIRTARCALEQGKRVLVHVAPGQASVARTLATGGARNLLDADGQFSSDYLIDQWESAPEPPQGQGELF
jgi:DNA processing protein